MAYQIEQMYDWLSYQEKISLVQDLQEFRRTSRIPHTICWNVVEMRKIVDFSWFIDKIITVVIHNNFINF